MDQAPHPISSPGARRRAKVAQFEEESRYIVTEPVACYYALLVGLALLPLGILGFIPPLTQGGVLLGILRVTPFTSALHLVTGIAGIVAFVVRRGRYAHFFTLLLTGVYLLTFSTGNLDFGNSESLPIGGGPDIPWILENALHVGLALTGALVTGLAALQHGDRATAQRYKERYGVTRPIEVFNGARSHGCRPSFGALRKLVPLGVLMLVTLALNRAGTVLARLPHPLRKRASA